MAAELSVKLEGSDKLQIKVDGVHKAIEIRDILDQAAAMILARIRQRFLDQTAPDGTKWPVSAAALERAASGRDGGTLFDTGKLFHSIQVHTEGENSRAISTDAANDHGVQYGVFHQYGTIHLPKRPFLGFSDDDIQLVEKMIEKRLKDVVT